MNKYILLCLFAVSLVMSSCGGSKEVAKAPVEMDDHAKQRMTKRKHNKDASKAALYAKLDFLDEGQISKLKKVHAKYDEKRANKIQEMMGNQSIKGAALQEIRDKETEEVKKIMSEDQYEQYFNIMLELGSRKKGTRGGKAPPPRTSK